MAHDCCNHDNSPKKQILPSLQNQREVGTLLTFKVSGMDCPDEINAIARALNVPGVNKVDSNIMNESVRVHHDESIDELTIKKLIETAGVKVVSGEKKSFLNAHRDRILLIASSGISLLAGLLIHWFVDSSAMITNILFAITILLSGIVIFPKAFRSIKVFNWDMNVLMSIAVIGAIFIKEYSEAASVIFLFSLAELLEALSVSRARKAIQDVLKVTPQNVLLITNNNEQISTNVRDLKLGDIVLIRAGESVPVDGVVFEGESSINQAPLTGESIPVTKKVGDRVLAGTLNELGILKVKVEKLFGDTKISKIISLIEEAQNQKAPSQRFVDQFSKIYTPSVLIIALLVAVVPPLLMSGSFDIWFYRALVFLVVGCPCALVIATPVSVVSGLTSLARRGVLVKGGVHLENLGKIKALALDKTGTITEGKPYVNDLKLFSTLSETEVIKIAATLESVSTHPLAKSILNYAKEKNINPTLQKNYKLITGRGAQAEVDGHLYFVGNHALAHEMGICSKEIEEYLKEVESKAQSVIILGHMPHMDCKGEIIAIFSIGDKIRSQAKDAISEFHKIGVKTIALLSGDNQKTVDSVAKIVGIDYAKGELLPDDKVREVKNLISSHKHIAMVGDGINDAPALAHATLGIAMGVAGSDTAIETADIALMQDDLLELPKAIVQGRRVLGVIRFNIIFALVIKAAFFVLAFFGYANLWIAVMVDMGASLIVTFNALRLLRN